MGEVLTAGPSAIVSLVCVFSWQTQNHFCCLAAFYLLYFLAELFSALLNARFVSGAQKTNVSLVEIRFFFDIGQQKRQTTCEYELREWV